MTRERWAMVLLVALVFGCLVVTLNATSKAQTPGTTPAYEMDVVPTAEYPLVLVLNRITGQVSICDLGDDLKGDWTNLGAPRAR